MCWLSPPLPLAARTPPPLGAVLAPRRGQPSTPIVLSLVLCCLSFLYMSSMIPTHNLSVCVALPFTPSRSRSGHCAGSWGLTNLSNPNNTNNPNDPNRFFFFRFPCQEGAWLAWKSKRTAWMQLIDMSARWPSPRQSQADLPAHARTQPRHSMARDSCTRAQRGMRAHHTVSIGTHRTISSGAFLSPLPPARV
jgi:hypothetical protein